MKGTAVDKTYERDILVLLIAYCVKELQLNNAQTGRIFRRDRADIKRIVDNSKPKRTK